MAIIGRGVMRETINALIDLLMILFLSANHSILSGWHWFQSLPPKTKLKLVIILMIGAGLLLFTQTTALNVFLVMFFLAGILLSIDAHLSFGVGLLLIVSIPLLPIMKKEGWAESIAMYAYCFLVIGVTHSLLNLYRNRHEK